MCTNITEKKNAAHVTCMHTQLA